MFFKIIQIYLHLAICRVYKGHLKNNLVYPVLMYTLFVEIQRYLEIRRIRFSETLHSRRQAPKVSVVKSI